MGYLGDMNTLVRTVGSVWNNMERDTVEIMTGITMSIQ